MEFWELKASSMINVEMTDTIINNNNETGIPITVLNKIYDKRVYHQCYSFSFLLQF